MTSQNSPFEQLREELQKEAKLDAKDRSKEYEGLTLQYFLEHGRKTEDHCLWRECHMLAEMLAILNRRFLALNPHKRREAELKEILASATGPLKSDHFEMLYKYEQEIDLDGRTEQEIDGTTTRYPSISRPELEMPAAENYLYATWGIARKQATRKASQPDAKDESKSQNTNPILSWKELTRELRKSFHSDAAISKAAQRSIEDYHGKKEDPWPMGGCASEYQIVTPEIRRNKDRPTPSSCKYQKISQDKTLNTQ